MKTSVMKMTLTTVSAEPLVMGFTKFDFGQLAMISAEGCMVDEGTRTYNNYKYKVKDFSERRCHL